MIYKLCLYVTGRTASSQRALDNLEEICSKELYGICDVEVVDVLENPGRADIDKILATPTLLKLLPAPVRKIIGDLSDREKALFGLDIIAADAAQIQRRA